MHTLSRRSFIRNSALTTAAISMGGLHFPPTDHRFSTIKEMSSLLKAKKMSSAELTKACLARIEQLNPKLNAFITVTKSMAIEDAARADQELAAGRWRGPLHGIPVAVKDSIDLKGVPTTAGTLVFKDHIPDVDAPVVAKLKEAGAVIIGKTNMEEFAISASSHTSQYGDVHNPWNLDRITGGSSSGSAAAVAAGLCYAALGTDTACSIRIPSALCGVTGLKPTWGLVSIRGIVPLAQPFDHCGPIVRSAEDAAIVLDAITGKHQAEGYRSAINKSILRVTKFQNFSVQVDPEIQAVYDNAVSTFKSLDLKQKDLPSIDMAALYSIFPTEVITYYRKVVQDNPTKCGAKIKWWTDQKDVPTSDYVRALHKMESDREQISDELFRDTDVCILPTQAVGAFKLEQVKASDTDFNGYISMNVNFNYLGLPAISVPCGFTGDGMPVGLQIVGPRYGEEKVLSAARWFQERTDFHKKYPTI